MEVMGASVWSKAKANRERGEDSWTARNGQKQITKHNMRVRENKMPGQGGLFKPHPVVLSFSKTRIEILEHNQKPGIWRRAPLVGRA